MDRTLVEAAGIPFVALWSGKWRRYFSWRNFVDPLLMLAGFFQAFYHLLRFWPEVVFIKGGSVGFPVAIAAWLLRFPLVLHESDTVMGLSNRIVARLANRVLLGFPGAMALSEKVQLVGNPVRPFLAEGSREKGYALTGFNADRPVVLIWGGSQGAQEINELVEANFEALKPHVQIVHVTGAGKAISIQDNAYKAFEYLGDPLADIYAITEVVVGRAGANSLAELAFLQKPNLLLPLKGAANHHQESNAAYFEAQGASLVLSDKTLLVPTLVALWDNKDQRQAMQRALDQIARPDAAEQITDLLTRGGRA